MMKVLVRGLFNFFRDIVDIAGKTFGFMKGKGITDVIWIVG